MERLSYSVGQVLFVIPDGKPRIVPVQVLEKRTSETADGISTVHIVKGPKPKSDPIQLESVKGKVFIALDEVKRVMLKNSNQAIEGMIQKTSVIVGKAFNVQRQEFAPPPMPHVSFLDDDEEDVPLPSALIAMAADRAKNDSVEVNVGNGGVAHVKLIPPPPVE